MNLHAMPLGRLDHDVIAMTDVTVAVFSHAGLRDLVTTDADMGVALRSLPLTQRELSQICGLTPVHINRVMKNCAKADAARCATGACVCTTGSEWRSWAPSTRRTCFCRKTRTAGNGREPGVLSCRSPSVIRSEAGQVLGYCTQAPGAAGCRA